MKIVRLSILSICLALSAFPFMSCNTDAPNNQVAITLVNNAFFPDTTSDLYENQSGQVLGISKCEGSPEVGDGASCASIELSSYVDFLIESPLTGIALPDSTVLSEFDSGFYWASFLFQTNDPENGCLVSAASGVFQIQQNQNTELTLTVGTPHSCDASPCAESETVCDGLCADLETDTANCGACGTSCSADEGCSGGTCTSLCGPSQSFCDGLCVNLETDSDHCGACGNACDSIDICIAGVCELDCPAGETACDNSCVDLNTDDDNCGECGLVCAGGESCVVGVCTL